MQSASYSRTFSCFYLMFVFFLRKAVKHFYETPNNRLEYMWLCTRKNYILFGDSLHMILKKNLRVSTELFICEKIDDLEWH